MADDSHEVSVSKTKKREATVDLKDRYKVWEESQRELINKIEQDDRKLARSARKIFAL